MRELSGLCFIRASSPLMRAPSGANHFSKPQVPKATTLEVRISTYKLGGGYANLLTHNGSKDERDS